MGPLLVFAVLGGSLGLVDREVKVFERAAAKEIRSKLQGEAARVKVEAEPDGLGVLWGALDRATITASGFSVDELPLFVEPERSQAGRCGNLTLRLHDFKLKGLRVESLDASIPACRYDRSLALKSKTFRLSRSGTGSGTVRILQDDLSAFVEAKYAEIKTARVQVRSGIVRVDGYGEFLIVKTDFTVIASLVPVDGERLELREATVWFDGRRADPFAAETLLKTLNPVVDFDSDLGLYGAVKVEKLELRDGVLTATGRTRIPVRPGSRPPMTVLPKGQERFRGVRPPDLLTGRLRPRLVPDRNFVDVFTEPDGLRRDLGTELEPFGP
ncbi:MAG: DUF2993 domain-containing protein [Armatimonadetes bacterium]|nr:DUF2993 domain-containing protein [Armatimonadota bacterium]